VKSLQSNDFTAQKHFSIIIPAFPISRNHKNLESVHQYTAAAKNEGGNAPVDYFTRL
jgi:hypothetical protein